MALPVKRLTSRRLLPTKRFGVLVLAVIILLAAESASTFSSVQLVHAQIPERPMLITGNVTFNGSPAPDGLILFATINSRAAGNTTTSGGQFTLQVDAIDGSSTSGETIQFSLGNLGTSQTATFDNTSNGGLLTMNLAFTGNVSEATQTTMSTSTQIPESEDTAIILLSTLAIALVLLTRRRSRTIVQRT
jgi:hypothetical protein